jgi:hypothetical protein
VHRGANSRRVAALVKHRFMNFIGECARHEPAAR